MDIDRDFGWNYNDSLINIPHVDNAIIITNPPYLSNYSAKRRKIHDNVQKYFDKTEYDDIYLLALEKMTKAQDYVVAIVPETFINSPFPKERVYSITIIEETLFEDTDTPISIVCFDGKRKSLYDIMVYKNGNFASSLGELEEKRLKPKNSKPRNSNIRFNVVGGNVGLRAVDTTNPKRKIEFMQKENLDYDLSGIKHSSRLITIIDVKLNGVNTNQFLTRCNNILNRYREETQDVLLSPFKGNMKNGVRRRRLDYETARAIMEMVLEGNETVKYQCRINNY